MDIQETEFGNVDNNEFFSGQSKVMCFCISGIWITVSLSPNYHNQKYMNLY
jgi:hypothetical protein